MLSTYVSKTTEQLEKDLETYETLVRLIKQVMADRKEEAERKQKKKHDDDIAKAKNMHLSYREVMKQDFEKMQQWKNVYQFEHDYEDDGVDRKHTNPVPAPVRASVPASVRASVRASVPASVPAPVPASDIMAQLASALQQLNLRMDKMEANNARENPPPPPPQQQEPNQQEPQQQQEDDEQL